MWNKIFRFLFIRSAILFSLFHIGIFTTCLATALAFEEYSHETWYRVLATGVGLLLASTTLSWWLVLAPLARLALMVRKIVYWRRWILKELPVLLASVPAFLEAIKKVFSKSHSTNNDASPNENPVAEIKSAVEAHPLKKNSASKSPKKAA